MIAHRLVGMLTTRKPSLSRGALDEEQARRCLVSEDTGSYSEVRVAGTVAKVRRKRDAESDNRGGNGDLDRLRIEILRGSHFPSHGVTIGRIMCCQRTSINRLLYCVGSPPSRK